MASIRDFVAPTRYLTASNLQEGDVGTPMEILDAAPTTMQDSKTKLGLKLMHQGNIVGYTCNASAAMSLLLAGHEDTDTLRGVHVQFSVVDIIEYNGFNKSLKLHVL